MIYLSDDYVDKYKEVFCYLLERAVEEQYSFSYIEYTLSHSRMVNEFEQSNVTLIAFSSLEKLYQEIFPFKENKSFKHNIYGKFGWISDAYINLYLNLNITFETIFIIFPLEDMLSLYKLYHEMSFSKLIDLKNEKVPYSYLDNIMKYRNVSTNELATKTGIPFSTINALRYAKRDIQKLESSRLLSISKTLSVKMESLLPDIYLNKA